MSSVRGLQRWTRASTPGERVRKTATKNKKRREGKSGSRGGSRRGLRSGVCGSMVGRLERHWTPVREKVQTMQFASCEAGPQNNSGA